MGAAILTQGMSSILPAVAGRACRHGKMLFLRGDRYIGRSLGLYGEYSEFEGRLFSRLIGAGQVVIEAGANIGAHTIHLARLVGPKGMVLAYEPQAVIYELLCANVALNKLRNVRTFHAAVGRAASRLKVPALDYTAEGNFGGVALRGVTAGERVAVVALDTLHLPSLRLIKMDVEGMEAEALSSARRLIARHRPLLYVENDREENCRRLLRLIARLGYTSWWHLPPLFNPKNYAGNRRNVFSGIVSANMLCVPEETPEAIAKLQKPGEPALALQRCH